jgi:hypothetical protein
MSGIKAETLKELLRRALNTRPDEVGCETCYEKLDQFVEMELAGKNASQALPLIKRHLELCSGCNDEYKALLVAIQRIQDTEGASG